MSVSEAAHNDRWLFRPADHAVAVAIRARDVDALRRLGAAGVAEFAKLLTDGEDALDWALNGFDTRGGPDLERFCDALLELGLPVMREDGRRFRWASYCQLIGALRWLLKRGHPTTPEFLNECLCQACEQPWYPTPEYEPEVRQTLQLLVSVGADPNAKGEHGESSLHVAAGSADVAPETIDELLRLGADPLATDDDGSTPLDLAMLFSDYDWTAQDCDLGEMPIDSRIAEAEKHIAAYPEDESAPAIRLLIEAMRCRLSP